MRGRSAGARAAVAASLLAPVVACLVGQDIEEAAPAPTIRNQAPRILKDTAAVNGRVGQTKYLTSRSCGPVRFEIGVVQDLDPQDSLEIRWFVNYDDSAANHGLVKTPPKRIPGGSDVQDGIRRDPGDEFTLELTGFPTNDPIVVEAWVSDGFEENELADGGPVEPLNRRIQAGKDFDSVSWVVKLSEGPVSCP